MKRYMLHACVLVLIAVALLLGGRTDSADAQDRLKTMPGYEQFQKMSKEIPGSYKSGAVSVTWKDEGKSFEYKHDGKVYRYDVAANKADVIGESKAGEGEGRGGRFGGAGKGGGGKGGQGKVGQGKGGQGKGGEGKRGGGGGVARGRQEGSALAPDGKHKAVYKDRNLWMTDADGKNEAAITADGSEKDRIKYGSASWVYGEELAQRTAMWWAPDSKKIAYYRFDESKVPDYFLALNQASTQDRMDIEAYPKVGAPNPVVDLYVYDVEAKKSQKIDVRDGKPFDNTVVGHYVYHVAWSPDVKELLFNRANRRQNIMEFVACDPATGKCRVIVREEWPASWVINSPQLRYLKDNNRFIWQSERTGWLNYYLYDLSGKLINPITNHSFEVANIIRVDEDAGLLYYMARDGDNYMKLQLHRVGLDGKGDKRLTDPAFNHAIDLAPDGKHMIDVAQTHDKPPVTRLLDVDGKVVAELAKSDMKRFDQLNLQRVELFTFKAGDGKTELHGLLHKPSNFDSTKKYPLLVSVYGGPHTNNNGARETFSTPSPLTEYGFLVANIDCRGLSGRGKQLLDSLYLKLGVTEIDDLASGVKELGKRAYVDKNRVGIFGTSYGGYASTLCLLRYPDVFQAACASSPVTDFRLYDSIYTERYMWMPPDNKKGYDEGSAMTHAGKLKGRLLLYFGTADNNVHPSNSLQLIRALQAAGKSFEVQVGPDAGHSGVSQQRMMEFFIENLKMTTVPIVTPSVKAE
jgi:dipeptidyl-peptidase 4